MVSAPNGPPPWAVLAEIAEIGTTETLEAVGVDGRAVGTINEPGTVRPKALIGRVALPRGECDSDACDPSLLIR